MTTTIRLRLSNQNKLPVPPKLHRSASPPPKRKARSTNLNEHQRQKRNGRLKERRKKKREKDSNENVTSAPPPSGIHIVRARVQPIDLFPEITADLLRRVNEYKELVKAHEEDPKKYAKPPKKQILPRKPTDNENAAALKQVQDTFTQVNYGYTKIYDETTSQLIAMVHYLPLKTMDQIQLEELNFLCLYLHRCKEFISRVASKTRTCGGVMWAIGWRKGYDTLEILGQYRCQESIDNNPKGYEEIMSDSSKAGEILWNVFHGFGNVAVEKNKAHMDSLGIPSIADNNFPKNPNDKSPFGFDSNLAFSSHGFYNFPHKDKGDLTDLPLAFAMILPTCKKTGLIAYASDGYNVKDGQFIFRDIKVAINFHPDTACLIIFKAQEYVHCTLKPSESNCFTKLGMSLQVATRTSNACKNYLEGVYDEETDMYFGGVEDILDY
ncbi:hypothetical protein PGTUg99_050246 [Puccinia graminis f. sp. tritici]|uniref:Tet-like 2OG-Fe(II) oxygenase domain-containing protein n=1 Tax=Puccinia graminis f. sp. tritici TaxID=56615 RepID=A0A5B0QLL7_PUCGR|nr:hypothetical protein PGTUg99_050246 [Puccinia graminis f. sp. tritici]